MRPDDWLRNLNSFLEDTSVIVAFAFLLVRGRALDLFQRRSPNRWIIGLTIGLAGCSEAVFPGDRFPYRMHAVVLCFGALECEPISIAVALALVCGAVTLTQRFAHPVVVIGESITVVGITLGLNWAARNLPRAWRLLGVPLAAQIAAAIPLALRRGTVEGGLPILASIVADYVGVILLLLVLEDARTRREAESLRVQAVEQRALSEAAKLNVLRAKLNPHFLFNALNAVASLCLIDGKRASKAVTRLAILMRRAVDHDVQRPIPLAQELEYVDAYLGIQGERFGNRLRWQLDVTTPNVLVPPLSIQTLVENAVIHGIVPRAEGGSLKIVSRKLKSGSLIAVQDNGVGFVRPASTDGESHGLEILDQQLRLGYGVRSRLRIFSTLGMGTIIAFRIPNAELP